MLLSIKGECLFLTKLGFCSSYTLRLRKLTEGTRVSMGTKGNAKHTVNRKVNADVRWEEQQELGKNKLIFYQDKGRKEAEESAGELKDVYRV
ncbi:hypothetical protein JTB14_014044 [Gonioctena quinquepunctata]|nr:hypothetical protein JTB14_014044 [Gonioctena quinquepunctata]